MTYIAFHSEHGTANVRGPERASAGIMCCDLLVIALGLRGYRTPEDMRAYLTLFPASHYLHRTPPDHYFGRALETAFAVEPEFFEPALNTALVLGSDVVKLMARLHGQCEIHAYVEGEDRAWLADLIEEGRNAEILRAEMGWESVVTLLRSTTDGPVVTSYSVTETFPNRHVAGAPFNRTDVDEDPVWNGLTTSYGWRLAMAGLRTEPLLRLLPSTWASYRFGDGQTGFDLLARVVFPNG